MVALALIGSGKDPGTVVSMSAGAWPGSKAEADVRTVCIADKSRQVAEQPPVERSKLARIPEQEGTAPRRRLAAGQPNDTGRPVPHPAGKGVRHSETASAASPWCDAATMETAFAAALAPAILLLCGISHPAAPAAAGIGVLAALGLGKAWVLNRRQAQRQSLEIIAVGIASATGGYGLGRLPAHWASQPFPEYNLTDPAEDA